MIRKNDNLRRQINHQIQKDQTQKVLSANQLSHPLLLNIAQYRKQVTSLAINCLKSHNRSSLTLNKQKEQKNKSISLAKQNKPNGSLNNQSKQLNFTKTTQTKKKKYNYFIGQQNEQLTLQKTQQQGNTNYGGVGLNQLNRMSSDHVKNSKSCSVLNKKAQHYITTPFVIDSHQNLAKATQGQSRNAKPTNFERVTLSKAHRPTSQQIWLQKPRSQTKNIYKSVQKRSGQNLHLSKPTQSAKNVFIPRQQKPTYPKTQTYTSRSDYNIQKLKNKLDSYIKKHISHPL